MRHFLHRNMSGGGDVKRSSLLPAVYYLLQSAPLKVPDHLNCLVKRETGAGVCSTSLCCPRNGKQVWTCQQVTVSHHGKTMRLV